MYPNARAHVLSSLAVVLYVPAPTTVMLTAHETVRIDRMERSEASGVTASRARTGHALWESAAGLDPHGHLLVAFTGHSDREPTAPDKPPAIAWCLHDGPLPLAEVAALLSAVPPTALITVIADTCYAAALSGGVITAAVIAVILSAPVICGQTHQGARQATTTAASAAIICLPPSGDGVVVAMSKSGDPGC